MMLPGPLEWVLEMLGFDWPKADEDKLRECARVWRDFADRVDEVNQQALTAADIVRSTNAGDDVDAFGRAFDKFTTGGDGYLADAATAARLIATAFDAAAMIVVACKIAVIAQLAILATEIIAAQGAALFTFGLSEVAALGATQATKMIVRRLLKELRDALVEAVVETIKDPIVSAVQGMISDLITQTVNQGFGAQDGYDLGRTAKKGVEAGAEAAENWKSTFGESLRDGLGSRAGSHVRGRAEASAAIGRGESDPAGGGDAAGGGTTGGGASGGGGSGSGGSGSGSSGNGGSGSGSSGNGGSGSGSSGNGGSGNGGSGSGSSGSGGSGGDGAGGGGNGSAGPSTTSATTGRAPEPGGPSSVNSPAGRDTSPESPASTPVPTPTPAPAAPSASDQRATASLDPFGTRLNADGPAEGSPSASPRADAPEAQASANATDAAPDASDAARPAEGQASAPTPADARAAAQQPAPEAQASAPTANAASDASDAARPTEGRAPTPTDGPSPADSRAATSQPGPESQAPPAPTAHPAADASRPTAVDPRIAAAQSAPGAQAPAPAAHAASDAARPADANSAATAGTSPHASAQPTAHDHATAGAPAHHAPSDSATGTGPAQHAERHGEDRSEGYGSVPGPRSDANSPAGEGSREGQVGVPAGAGQHGRPAAEPSAQRHDTPHAQPGDGRNDGRRAEDGTQQAATVRTAGAAAVAEAPPAHGPGPVAGESAAPSSAPYAGQAGQAAPGAPAAGAVPTGAGGVPSATGTPGTPSAGAPRADRPATTAPTAAPGQRQRPDQSRPDRPVSLGQQPTGGRPDPRTAPWRTPQPSDSPTPRPDARPTPAADPRAARPDRPADGQSRPGADPRRSVPEQRPSSERPTADDPSAEHPTTEHPSQDHPSAEHPTAEHPTAEHPGVDPTRPVTAGRPYGEPGGLIEPGERERQRVEDAVPRDAEGRPLRHPDPEGDWPGAVNGDPNEPGRRNNCVDVALATVDTYSGHPTPAAARTPDHDADGNPSDRGERGGRDRMENALGARFSDLGDGPAAYRRLEDTLRREGHGSQAVIITRDADGRAHAWNAVNHRGKITYIDAQTGRRSDRPLHDGENGVFAVPLGADRRPAAPVPHADPHHDPSLDRRAPEEIAGGDNGQNGPPGPPGRVERPDFMGDPPDHYGPPGSLTKAQIEQIQVYRANEEAGYRELYYDKNGHRKLLETVDESGYTPPQLAQFEDDGPWLPAKDGPEAPKPHYLDPKPVHLDADGVKDAQSLKDLDELAEKRSEAVAQMVKDRQWKKESGLPEADAAYSASQYAMQEASENFGEGAAALHYMALQDSGFEPETLGGPDNGADQFDQVWKHPDGRFIVIEAKGSPDAPLGTRLMPGAGRQRVSQGSREYFLQIVELMKKRGERTLAKELTAALGAGKVEYVLVMGGRNDGSYNGLDYRRFDTSRGTLP
ncbi:toxin glutamine deamidase domain-containing protein [Kitasatospora sp. NPDC004272]